MKSDFQFYKFDELYEMSSGISTNSSQAGHGSPFLSFSTIFNNYFIPDKLLDLMDTTKQEQETYSIKKGDIFLTRTSETLDQLAMSTVALRDYPQATYSGFSKRLRPKCEGITYDKFMGFYLRSNYFRKIINNNAIMTLRASFNEAIFSYLKLYLPNYQVQKKIGDLLFSIEEKIMLNNEINEELQAMSKTLYDYWFVQFDFPDKNSKPYKTSGGKMVWSEELKKEIPEGWEVCKMSEWIESDKSGDWGKESLQGNYIQKVYCIRGTDINGLNGIGECSPPIRYIHHKNAFKILESHDLIIEISGGSPTQSTGRMAYITDDTVKRFENPLICSNFCKAVSIKNKKLLYNFAYYWNRLYENGVFFGYEGKTSGIKNLLLDSFVSSHWTVVPQESIVNKFYEIMQDIQAKKQNALAENQKLSELRHWMLPMLMNGQVKVE